MKRLLLCLFMLAINIGCWAQIFTSGVWKYTVSNGQAIIGGTTQTNITNPVIPSTMGGYPTQIPNAAFSGRTDLTGSLTILGNQTNIGNGAFSDCTGLTSVTISGSITSIGNSAFSGCTGLKSATLALTGSTTFGNSIFGNCSELRYIDASNSSASTFTSVYLPQKFASKFYTLLYFPAGAKPTGIGGNVIIGDVCSTFALHESISIGANGYGTYGCEFGTAVIKPFTATSAQYSGKFLTDDGVYTLYLPFNLDLPTTMEAYTLSKYSNKTAVFKKYVGTLKAYTPYLIRRVAGSGNQVLEKIMSNVYVATAPNYLTNPNAGSATDKGTGTWKFLGTTNPISNATAAANRLYVLEADNTWRPVKSTSSTGYVRSLRAFLQAPAGYSGAPLAFILDEEDTPTGVEEIEAEVKKENVDIYTIEGRFVGRNYESLPSGLYIIGGKKVYKF